MNSALSISRFFPTSLEKYESDYYRAHLGTSFKLRAKGTAVVTATLAEVKNLKNHPRPDGKHLSRRKPYSLIFECQAGILPQANYELEHDILDTHAVFLVCIGADDGKTHLEAIFN